MYVMLPSPITILCALITNNVFTDKLAAVTKIQLFVQVHSQNFTNNYRSHGFTKLLDKSIIACVVAIACIEHIQVNNYADVAISGIE